jgi:hypothetical protein
VFWFGGIFLYELLHQPLKRDRLTLSIEIADRYKRNGPNQTVAHFRNFCSPFSAHFWRKPTQRRFLLLSPERQTIASVPGEFESQLMR